MHSYLPVSTFWQFVIFYCYHYSLGVVLSLVMCIQLWVEHRTFLLPNFEWDFYAESGESVSRRLDALFLPQDAICNENVALLQNKSLIKLQPWAITISTFNINVGDHSSEATYPSLVTLPTTNVGHMTRLTCVIFWPKKTRRKFASIIFLYIYL